MSGLFAVVVDMETTGLSTETDVPIEIAVAVINKDGAVGSSRKYLIFPSDSIQANYWDAAITRGQENRIVGPMHEKNGLWYELYDMDYPKFSAEEADREIVNWLSAGGIEPGTLPMMGNSIGSLDRPFVQKFFPKFNKFLHYRNVDISTIRVICEAHMPHMNAAILDSAKRSDNHRAMDDVMDCIAQYQAYIDSFFFIAPEGD